MVGGCLCGGVRFELTEPAPVAGYCHCTRCQRRTGTAASAQARIDGGTFRLLQGEDLVLDRPAPTRTRSSGRPLPDDYQPAVAGSRVGDGGVAINPLACMVSRKTSRVSAEGSQPIAAFSFSFETTHG
jgi:hypothetical protein